VFFFIKRDLFLYFFIDCLITCLKESIMKLYAYLDASRLGVLAKT
jgi:hypothetical protein